MNHYFFDAAILAALGFTLFHTTYLGRRIMSLQDTVDQLTAQVAKIQTEVLDAKADLEAKLADVQSQLTAGVPAEQVDLTGLASAIQALDDINPDPVADAPVE